MPGGRGFSKIDRWPQTCVIAAQRSFARQRGANRASFIPVTKASASVKFPGKSAIISVSKAAVPVPPSGIKKISTDYWKKEYAPSEFRELIAKKIKEAHFFNALIKDNMLNIAFGDGAHDHISGQSHLAPFVIKGIYDPNEKLLELIMKVDCLNANYHKISYFMYVVFARVLVEHGFPERTGLGYKTNLCFAELEYLCDIEPKTLGELARLPLPGENTSASGDTFPPV